jgi:hypothetical protein
MAATLLLEAGAGELDAAVGDEVLGHRANGSGSATEDLAGPLKRRLSRRSRGEFTSPKGRLQRFFLK